jgi:hypothetical protein
LPWNRTAPPARTRPDNLLAWLADMAVDLGRVLRNWHRHVEYGPVPGAYYPLVFQRLLPLGLGAAATINLHPMVSQFRPVAVSAWCNTGTLTARLRVTGPSDLLAANLAVSSTPVRRNSGADFAVSPVPAGSDVWLEIVSIDSGTPLEVVVHLLCQDLSKAGSG